MARKMAEAFSDGKASTKSRDGIFLIGSARAAAEARQRLDEIEAQITAFEADPAYQQLLSQRETLHTRLNDWVLDHHQGKDDAFEAGDWRGTPVRAIIGKWDGDKLVKLVPKNLFLKMVDLVPSPQKI